jgi:hypothetical protein
MGRSAYKRCPKEMCSNFHTAIWRPVYVPMLCYGQAAEGHLDRYDMYIGVASLPRAWHW